MPARNLLRVSHQGAYLHIYNKGVEDKLIFSDEEDYQTFLGYLKEYLTNPSDIEIQKKSFTVKGHTYHGTPHLPKNYFNKIDLIAYTLMPDHFHLVVHQRLEGMLQSFIRSLCTRYSIYFNKKYQRHGALFEGPYKSSHITDTNVLLHLVAYLHTNHTNNDHSSASEYAEEKTNSWVSTTEVKNVFGDAENNNSQDKASYNDFISDYIYNDIERDILSAVIIETHQLPLESNITITPHIQTLIPEVRSIPKKQHARIPEYITLSLIFVVLLGLGVRNISVTSLEAKSDEPTISEIVQPEIWTEPKVDTSALEAVSSIDSVLAASDSASPDTATESATSFIDPKTLLYSYVVVKPGSGTVVIYKDQSIDSGVITTAHDGDHFVAFPVDADWYEIHFSDDTSGFVLSKNINIEQSKSQ